MDREKIIQMIEDMKKNLNPVQPLFVQEVIQMLENIQFELRKP